MGFDTLWPAVFPGTRIRSSVSWLLRTVGQSRLTWVPRKPSIRVTWLRLTLLGPHWAGPQGSHLLRLGSVYRLAPEAPLFRGMPMRLKVFFEPPGVCGLRFCAWYLQLKKSLVSNSHVREAFHKFQSYLGSQHFRPAVFSGTRIGLGVSWLFWTVGQGYLTWVPGKSSIRVTWLKPTLLGPSPRLSACLGLSPGTWGVPFQGNTIGAQGIFEAARCVLATALLSLSTPTLKWPCATLWCDGMPNKF